MTRIDSSLKTSDFDFYLPPELIAQHPTTPRDQARLLIVQRATEQLKHEFFYTIANHLETGDVLVINTSKVIPARLFGKKSTGGQVEIFLLHEYAPTHWKALVRGKRCSAGTSVYLDQGFKIQLVEQHSDGTWDISINQPNITSIGQVPLPPYIQASAEMEDYQTVYAQTVGSVAAPTAGLHFTPELLEVIKNKGIKIMPVMLHVGLGTFLPVRSERLVDHTMHAEYAELPAETAAALQQARADHKKIIAVGTTTVRTLEGFNGQANSDWLNIFITPGYKFNWVDAMITNFHLPKSTLLMLVSAFAGKSLIKQAYHTAIQEDYRFYSFGDAMYID